ncbi:helix-turn-helix domain-containing protein [Roseomonas sp. CAU 1739]|uniref:helix-turn-helix domain-containing protein n=1 Tax=Roseomonas sp. CAU 1739 TaxID=3140364 RepID=UPI0038CF3288
MKNDQSQADQSNLGGDASRMESTSQVRIFPTHTPDHKSIDIHVGGRVRKQRLRVGLSQEGLASAIGVPVSQIQTLESGHTRARATRLHDISIALKVPISFFFGTTDSGAGTDVEQRTSDSLRETVRNHDTNDSQEVRDLLRAYFAIPDARLRTQVLELMQSLCSPRRSSVARASHR